MSATPSEIEDAIERGERLAYRLCEVSALLGIPVSTLRAMVRRGEINPVTSFGTWLLTAEDLRDLLNKRLR